MLVGLCLITLFAITAVGWHSSEATKLFLILISPFSLQASPKPLKTTGEPHNMTMETGSEVRMTQTLETNPCQVLDNQRYQTSTLCSTLPLRRLRIVVAMTGATGSLYAIKLLENLRQLNIESHLIVSNWAQATTKYETDMKASAIRQLATRVYSINDQAAPISSGSFLHDGMIVVPCSMKMMAAIRVGYCNDLISRAADVSIKERRRLVLVVRETPLSVIHLDNMLFLARAGAVIFPPVPAFYTRPKTIDDIVEQAVGRMLDSLDIHSDGFKRWDGMGAT